MLTPRVGDPHMRGEDAAGFPTTCRMLVHPHVRGADVHELNGAALQRTTRYRDFPQFWGCGGQVALVDVERSASSAIRP